MCIGLIVCEEENVDKIVQSRANRRTTTRVRREIHAGFNEEKNPNKKQESYEIGMRFKCLHEAYMLVPF